jgi:hypothetical protein
MDLYSWLRHVWLADGYSSGTSVERNTPGHLEHHIHTNHRSIRDWDVWESRSWMHGLPQAAQVNNSQPPVAGLFDVAVLAEL